MGVFDIREMGLLDKMSTLDYVDLIWNPMVTHGDLITNDERP